MATAQTKPFQCQPSSLKEIVAQFLKTKNHTRSDVENDREFYTPGELTQKYPRLPLDCLEFIDTVDMCFVCLKATAKIAFRATFSSLNGKEDLDYVVCPDCILHTKEFTDMFENLYEAREEKMKKGWWPA